MLAKRINQIRTSATMAVTARAQELKAEGVDIISLCAGEPDFDTPPHIVEAAGEAMEAGLTKYTPTPGTPELRAAVAEDSARVRGVPCAPDQVIIGVGAKQAIYGFFQAAVDPGDEVIIPAPHWVSYPDQVKLAGGTPVIAETRAETGFTLEVDEYRRKRTGKTKALVINTPGNPTGGVYSKEATEAITEAAAKDGVWVLCDEVYRELTYGGARHTSPLSLARGAARDRIFVADGVSKSFAMTGWRIGWGIGHPEVIGAMTKIQSQSTSCPSSVSQAAALAALRGPRDFLDGWKERYERLRDTLCQGLDALPGMTCALPQGAFYALPSVKGVIKRLGTDATDVTVSTFLLEKAHVATVPGSAFGAPGHIRLSYAASLDLIEKALTRMEEALSKIEK